jgi:hypothetical protein
MHRPGPVRCYDAAICIVRTCRHCFAGNRIQIGQGPICNPEAVAPHNVSPSTCCRHCVGAQHTPVIRCHASALWLACWWVGWVTHQVAEYGVMVELRREGDQAQHCCGEKMSGKPHGWHHALALHREVSLGPGTQRFWTEQRMWGMVRAAHSSCGHGSRAAAGGCRCSCAWRCRCPHALCRRWLV